MCGLGLGSQFGLRVMAKGLKLNDLTPAYRQAGTPPPRKLSPNSLFVIASDRRERTCTPKCVTARRRGNPTKSLRGRSPWQSQEFPRFALYTMRCRASLGTRLQSFHSLAMTLRHSLPEEKGNGEGETCRVHSYVNPLSSWSSF